MKTRIIAILASIVSVICLADDPPMVHWEETFSKAPATNSSINVSNKCDLYADHAGWAGFRAFLSSVVGALQIGTGDSHNSGVLVTPPLSEIPDEPTLVLTVGFKEKGSTGRRAPMGILRDGATNALDDVVFETGTDFREYAVSLPPIVEGDRIVIGSVTNRADARILLDSVRIVAGGGGGETIPETNGLAWNMARGTYVQDFNALADVTYPAPFEDVAAVVVGLQACTNGVALSEFKFNEGTTQYGGVYVFATNKKDRASFSMGSMAVAGRDCVYGLAHSNGTEFVATNVAVSFDARQLNSKNPNANVLKFQYLVTNELVSVAAEGGWIDVPELSWTMPLTTASAEGFAETNLRASLPISVRKGEHVIYRWIDVDEDGRDACSAIDNVEMRYSFRESRGLVITLQ